MKRRLLSTLILSALFSCGASAQAIGYTYDAGGNDSAVTINCYVNGPESLATDPNNTLFQHEYGHYLQSQSWAGLPVEGRHTEYDETLNNLKIY